MHKDLLKKDTWIDLLVWIGDLPFPPLDKLMRATAIYVVVHFVVKWW